MNYADIPEEEVSEEGAEAVNVRWLIAGRDGAPNFAMRLFEVLPGGFTPLHSHPWEHEVFVLRGRGKVVGGGKEFGLREGDFVFVPPEEEHQFKNDHDRVLSFLCLIPLKGAGGR